MYSEINCIVFTSCIIFVTLFCIDKFHIRWVITPMDQMKAK